MTDPTNESPSGRELSRSAAAMPRWVKVFLMTAAVLVVLVATVMLLSGGQHGPGRHVSSSASTGGYRQVALSHAPVIWRH